MERLTEAERLPILPKRKEVVSRERLKEMAGDGWRERERREREERELNTPVRLVAFIEGGAVEVFGGSAEGCGLLLCFLLTHTHTHASALSLWCESLQILEAWEGAQCCCIATQSSGPGNALADGSRGGPYLQIEPQEPSAVIPPISHMKQILCVSNTGLTPAITQLLKQLSHRGDGGSVARECWGAAI